MLTHWGMVESACNTCHQQFASNLQVHHFRACCSAGPGTIRALSSCEHLQEEVQQAAFHLGVRAAEGRQGVPCAIQAPGSRAAPRRAPLPLGFDAWGTLKGGSTPIASGHAEHMSSGTG